MSKISTLIGEITDVRYFAYLYEFAVILIGIL